MRPVQSMKKEELLQLFDSKDATDRTQRFHFSSAFYDVSVWPVENIRDYWMVRYLNRMRLTNFFFGNEAPWGLLLEMFSFYHNKTMDKERWIEEMRALWHRLGTKSVPHYYYYSMNYGFQIYFDGRKHVNGQPSTEKNCRGSTIYRRRSMSN